MTSAAPAHYRLLTRLALSATFLLCCLSPVSRADASRTPSAGKLKIALVGDSTVTDTAGWGKGFAGCLKDDISCINLSKGGRSSKSYISEGLWRKVLELKPDYVLLQFGHNDQPGKGSDRETEPQTGYRKYMTQYVDEARAAGIKPVLVTSLSRRQWGADGKIHSTLQPYVDVVKDIAATKNVPLIDLHALSIALYEKMGQDAVLEISPLKKADPAATNPAPATPAKTVVDGTHLNEKGSQRIGPIVAEALKKSVPDLAAHIK